MVVVSKKQARKTKPKIQNRGQSGIEIMVMIGVVLVLSSIILFALNERNLNVEKARQLLAGQREVEKLASAINSAAIGGKNFEVNVTVSNRTGVVVADSFVVSGKARKVEMRWQGPRNETLVVSARLLTSKVKDANVRTALVSVNNTGDNIEVKCWNADGTDTQKC